MTRSSINDPDLDLDLALAAQESLDAALLLATMPNYGQIEEVDPATRASMIDRLVQEGASPNAVSVKNGNTPLCHAILRRDPGLIDHLIRLGATIDLPPVSKRQTPALHLAAWQGDLDTLLHLVALGASVDHRDAHAQTALFHACMNDQAAIIAALVGKGADLNARDHQGHNALENLALRVPVEGTNDHWRQTFNVLLDCYPPSQRAAAVQNAMKAIVDTDRFAGDRVSQKVVYQTKLYLEDLLATLPPVQGEPLGPWETVHHITNYFDHPLEGLADVDGAPHVFFLADEVVRCIPSQSGQSDEDDYEVDTVYALHPASTDLVAALVEKHAIFERWHQAYTAKQASHEDHPALPADRARYQELTERITPVLATLRAAPAPQLRLGEFVRGRVPVALGESAWKSYQVRWGMVPQVPR